MSKTFIKINEDLRNSKEYLSTLYDPKTKFLKSKLINEETVKQIQRLLK